MTNAQAAELLARDAAATGTHSRECREGTAEAFDGFSDGCAPCGVAASAFAAAEAVDGWRQAAEAELWEHAERERDEAFYGRAF